MPSARARPQGVPAPTQHQPTALAPWISSFIVLSELQHRDILCRRPEIPVAGHLSHFLPFWLEVIQADRWVLEVVSQGYSIELLQTPQYRGVRNTSWLKSETLAVNILKGYVTAILCRHALVRGMNLSLDPSIQ